MVAAAPRSMARVTTSCCALTVVPVRSPQPIILAVALPMTLSSSKNSEIRRPSFHPPSAAPAAVPAGATGPSCVKVLPDASARSVNPRTSVPMLTPIEARTPSKLVSAVRRVWTLGDERADATPPSPRELPALVPAPSTFFSAVSAVFDAATIWSKFARKVAAIAMARAPCSTAQVRRCSHPGLVHGPTRRASRSGGRWRDRWRSLLAIPAVFFRRPLGVHRDLVGFDRAEDLGIRVGTDRVERGFDRLVSLPANRDHLPVQPLERPVDQIREH